MKTDKLKTFLYISVAALAILLLLGGFLAYVIHRKISPDLRKDIHAGMQARNISDPDARLRKYLENRYGSLTEASNREAAFLGLFDIEHIKSMQLIIRHSPDDMRQANIDAMARYLASYRTNMTSQEKADLHTFFKTQEGGAMLKHATTQYNSQDVQYRGQTAPVISQLLNTIQSVQNP